MRAKEDQTCNHCYGTEYQFSQIPDRDMYVCKDCHAYFTGQELELMHVLDLNSYNRVSFVYDLFEKKQINEAQKIERLTALEGQTLYKNAYPFRTHWVLDPGPENTTPVEIPGGVKSEKTFLVSETGGRKEVKDQRYSLIPPEALRHLAEIYGRGASKYEDNNWRKGYQFSASIDALQRHFEAFRSGENYDPESGQAHIMHAAWHCFALYVFSTNPRYAEFDDRWNEGD